MKTIQDRIRAVRGHFCKRRDANAEFSERVGESQATTSNWMNKDREVGMAVVMKVLDAFPEVNSDWLIKGEGEMLKPTPCSMVQEPQTPYGQSVPEFVVREMIEARKRADEINLLNAESMSRLAKAIEAKLNHDCSCGDISKAN